MSAADEVMKYFNCLGDHVDQRWTAQGRKAHRLADIATAALSDIPVPKELTPEIVLALLAAGTQLPKQTASSDTFGQPPAVMYRTPNLHIQALTWMEGTTAIHQHGFDGAFRVLCGSSLHVPYSFDISDTLADGHLVLGRMAMLESEILQAGDVRSIVGGPDFIHALFHLERPSMTIVVRNGSSDLPYPQYEYRAPGLGTDNLDSDDKLRMRLRGLHSLYRLDREHAASIALEIIANQDLWTAFRVCDNWALTYGESTQLSDLIDVLSLRSNELGKILLPMYAEEVRRGRLLVRRGMLRESRHRLFLALMVNLPDRGSISRAMAQLFPGEDPSNYIVKMVGELASPEYRGLSGLSLGADELALLRVRLLDEPGEEALATMAARWKPPALLQSLFFSDPIANAS